MNRETKRLVAKQQAQAERERVRAANLTGKRSAIDDGPKERRFKRWMRFLKEVRLELKKVSWPTGSEVFTYTMVVITTVVFITAIVFVLDLLFANTILDLFTS